MLYKVFLVFYKSILCNQLYYSLTALS